MYVIRSFPIQYAGTKEEISRKNELKHVRDISKYVDNRKTGVLSLYYSYDYVVVEFPPKTIVHLLICYIIL